MSLASVLKSIAINVALLFGSVFLTLLLLEGIFRLFDVRFSSYHPISGFCRYDEILGWRLVPDREGLFKGKGFSVQVEQSEQGLRDRFYPWEREANRKRILVLGDSVVWCWGVEMSDCFTEVVADALPMTDVIAAGVPGYGTAQEVLLYEQELARFRPDLVLLLFVSNDLSDNFEERKRPLFELRDGNLVLGNVPVPRRKSMRKEWLQAHSALFRQVNHAAQVVQLMLRMVREGTHLERKGDYAPIAPADESQARRITEALIDRLARSVAKGGGRLAIVNSGGPEDLGRWLEGFSRDRSVPYLDLAPTLERGEAAGSTTRLPADSHFSAEGHTIAAGAILDFLRSENLLNNFTARN